MQTSSGLIEIAPVIDICAEHIQAMACQPAFGVALSTLRGVVELGEYERVRELWPAFATHISSACLFLPRMPSLTAENQLPF
ncbi:hypothetical protein K458DRAFT_177924 [Lentithecium fluviatile CBS 122367]|uniref:Uncharacterized protein n=1 Tax=Lentithecium fluviatile CBS 122367 TaxID=1168545 RepID=A0A6G1IG07_9PLEO|nr:hypothetical protein K458DRAFT_177924 [Lentithecium fluviatile CBS 122367]